MSKETRSKEDLREVVWSFAELCAAKLRKQRSCAGALMLFIHKNFFKENAQQYSNERMIKLKVASSVANEIKRYARRKGNFIRKLYRKLNKKVYSLYLPSFLS